MAALKHKVVGGSLSQEEWEGTDIHEGHDKALHDALGITPGTHAGSHKSGQSDEIDLDELGVPTGSVSMNSQRLTSLGAPSAQDDALRYGRAEITDAEIAAANKDGATGTACMRTLGTGAQQAAAGNHTHTLTAEAQSVSKSEIARDGGGSFSAYQAQKGIAAESDLDFVSKTDSFSTTSKAVAGAAGWWWASASDSVKARIYMDGVQVGESAYLDGSALTFTTVTGNYSLSGSKIVKLSFHNYSASPRSLFYLTIDTTTAKHTTVLIIGAVKL